MCLNKNELLLSAGFGLLFQGLDLKQDGKLAQEHQRLVRCVVNVMERDNFPGVSAFKKMACSVIALERPTKPTNMQDSPCPLKREPFANSSTAQSTPIPVNPYMQNAASQFSFNPTQALKQETLNDRRSTVSDLALESYSRTPSLISTQSIESEHTPPQVPADTRMSQPRMLSPPNNETPNLDYLCFNEDILQNPWFTPEAKPAPLAFEWEGLLCYNDSSQPSPTDSLFDSTSPSVQPSQLNVSSYNTDTSPSTSGHEWSPITWSLMDTSTPDRTNTDNAMSFSSEGGVTNEDDLNGAESSTDYRGILMPNLDNFEELDGSFGI